MSDTTPPRRLAALVGELPRDRRPLYATLASRLRLLISDGRVPALTRLPAERELARELGHSRATVTAAYARLRDDGWADARRGAGTWTRLPDTRRRSAWVPEPVDDDRIDMVHAAPAAPPGLAAALTAALDDLPRLLAGHGYHPAGLPDLRACVADRYTARGLATTPEQVLITAGALHGVTVALSVLARRGQPVVIEHPSYPNAIDGLRRLGLRAVPVAIGEDSTAFVGELARASAQVQAPVAYVMPDFQNPTGQLLDTASRARLSGGLHRAGTTALVDETFCELGLDALAPAPQAAAGPAQTVTVGTLSKSVWGGLRIGWLRASPALVRRLTDAAVASHLSGPAIEQLAACHLLDGLASMLAERRAETRRRRDALLAALAARLPGWRVNRPPGGLVTWCALPSPRSSALVAAAEHRGLRIAAGPRFSTGHAFEDRLRLPYTQPIEVLQRAVALLAETDAAVAVAADGPRRRAAAAREPQPVI